MKGIGLTGLVLASTVVTLGGFAFGEDSRTDAFIFKSDEGEYSMSYAQPSTKNFRNNSGIAFSLDLRPSQARPLPANAKVSALVSEPKASLRYTVERYRFFTQCDRAPKLEVLQITYVDASRVLGSLKIPLNTFWEAEPGTVGGDAYKVACEMVAENEKIYGDELPSADNATE